ncbi:MAG: glycosyltransferase family 2 protein [Ferruginibacter sp.]|nr:glycosyltransferase family 2 protein [Cytophagales bacterium]
MSSPPKVYLLILNYNGWEDTIENLESALQQDYSNYQVVVVDNHSPNHSLDYIRQWAEGRLDVWTPPGSPLRHLITPRLHKPVPYDLLTAQTLPDRSPGQLTKPLTLIQAGTNEGFAAGNNLFLNFVLREDAYVWLLNPDMLAERNAVSQLVSYAQSAREDAVIGCVIRDYLTPSKLLIYGGGRNNPLSGTITFIQEQQQSDQLDYIHGGALFTHLRNFERIGLLPEEYFLYGEEQDWCHQAKSAGIAMAVCGSAVGYDKVSTSIGKGSRAEYFYTRNALMFYKKYYGRFIPIILGFNVLRVAKRLLQRETGRARAVVNASRDFMLSRSGNMPSRTS